MIFQKICLIFQSIQKNTEKNENLYFTEFYDLDEWEFIHKGEDSSAYVIESYDPGLELGVSEINDWISGYYNIWMTDVRLEVNFQFYSGPEDTYIDVYCRSNDDGEVAFSVYADGFWEIGHYNYSGDGDYTSLVSGQSSLEAGENFLVGYCEGEDIVLYINGEFVGETIDDAVSEGVVGVGLLSDESGGGEWIFNYFAAENLD